MKDPKRRGAKAPTNNQTRANLRLATDAYERLLIHSVKEKRPAGEIVSQLIEEHLRRWSMPGDLSARVKNAAAVIESSRAITDARASESVADLAA
jgi:hypothetical protein